MNLPKIGQDTIDRMLKELITLYGSAMNISEERHSNGQTRYRIKEVEGTPGVWIKKQTVFDKLYSRGLNEYSKKSGDLENRLYLPQVAAA